VVIAIDGNAVDDLTDLRNSIGENPPGAKVEITYVRDGRSKDVVLTLAERPQSAALAGAPGPGPADKSQAQAAGMTVAELSPELADRLDIESGYEGVVVIDLDPSSRAARAGVMVGDIIFRMNRTEVKSVSDFERTAKNSEGRALLLHLRRGGSSLFIVVPE
jgi:S1-C subfamily serine protease